jgi:3-hydroxyisobutyrate dehydrogenase-like beta-hydroxyacid dehydrogenase
MNSRRVAFIGLGAMGEPMAGNLVQRGFAVTVVGHRRPEPVARLSALGATAAGSAQEAVAGRDVIILMLPDSDQVDRVVTGGDGILGAMQAGSCLVDCSTSDPARSRAIAELAKRRGVAYVDAPVTRGVQGAKQAKLAFFVGGAPSAIESVRPLLDAMGDTIFLMGDAGSGHATKIIVQALSYGTVALINEALMLGAAEGLALPRLQEALVAGAGSKALESFGPRIIERQYAPARVVVSDALRHMATASRMAEGAACPRFVHAAAEESLQLLAARGLARSDLSSLAEIWPVAGAEPQ